MAVKLDKLANFIEMLGRKGALMILDSLARSPKRYNELRETCSSDRTLSLRLKELEDSGLIGGIRKKSGGRYAVYYSMTERGREVIEKIKGIK